MIDTNDSIVVTGGAGFLGSHLTEELQSRGYEEVFVPRSSEYDLRNPGAIKQLYEDIEPDGVIHAAATVGGIGANRERPGEFFYDNAIMGIELIEQARRYDIKKFVTLGTICSYPKHTPVPFSEEDLWDGYPEETNAPYGIAKKALLTQGRAYRRQYGFNSIHLLPVNLYGPRDDFDPKTSHVIPAIIKKCIDAKKQGNDSITAWGTGEPTREFLYVTDAARGIVDAMEDYNSPEPMNLGSGHEISIKELIRTIVEVTEYEGEIIWDRSKPDGQPRRCLDISRANKNLDWEPKIELREGIRSVVDWYLDQRSDV
ncbi:GDP-L-fucose synthase [Halorubrum sp. BV1]|uniref:GDP-L-fucose synthase family protein n=1 Tax=Halorubrum sp. BV1 TaxID=1498500 RepID=UPI00067935E5|nr:GDP-L-fucose synthase [Halorubrum sp. BV1]